MNWAGEATPVTILLYALNACKMHAGSRTSYKFFKLSKYFIIVVVVVVLYVAINAGLCKDADYHLLNH